VPGCVVEQQQDLPARDVIAPAGRPGLQAGRDLLGGDPGGQQQAGQPVRRIHRPLPGGVGVQRQEELPVREAPGQPVGGVHGQGGLADPGHSVDRVNAQHHATRRGGQCLQQPRQFTLAAGEADGIPRQGPGGCRCGGSRCLFPPGRQHVLRRSLAPRRRDKQRAYRLGQAQRIGQQLRGVLAGGPVDAPLQVTDRPRAHACRLRQLLLRQPGLRPQSPQQPGERKRRLLRHRRKTPSQTPACSHPTRNGPGPNPQAYAGMFTPGHPPERGHRADRLRRGWPLPPHSASSH